MYFFRVEISSFDDEKKVLYLIPDQSDTDEHGIPFQEKLLTSSPQYKEFVKETKTSVVDVEYTVYRTSAPIAGAITDESFEQMSQDNALELLDGNEFSITTGKSAKSSGKGGNKSTYIVFGMIATVIVLMIIISAVTGNKGEGKAGTGTTEATAEITAEIKTNESETHEAVTTEPVSATKEPEQLTSEPAFVDTPPQETAESITADTQTAEPENVVSSSSGGSTSSSTQSEYTISFHANGGTGTLAVTEKPHNKAVLPCSDKRAEQAQPESETLLRQKVGASYAETSELYSNKTKDNNPDIINPSITRTREEPEESCVPVADMIDGMDFEQLKEERACYAQIVRDNTDYDILVEQFPEQADEINELISIMVDVICSQKKTIRANGEEKPHDVVKSRLLKLNSSHIEYVLAALKKNTSDVRNIRSYLITALYNAPVTMSSFYRAEVNHDMFGKR